jgi:hypothetical protein
VQQAYVQAAARFAQHFTTAPGRLNPDLVKERQAAWSTYSVGASVIRSPEASRIQPALDAMRGGVMIDGVPKEGR